MPSTSGSGHDSVVSGTRIRTVISHCRSTRRRSSSSRSLRPRHRRIGRLLRERPQPPDERAHLQLAVLELILDLFETLARGRRDRVRAAVAPPPAAARCRPPTAAGYRECPAPAAAAPRAPRPCRDAAADTGCRAATPPAAPQSRRRSDRRSSCAACPARTAGRGSTPRRGSRTAPAPCRSGPAAPDESAGRCAAGTIRRTSGSRWPVSPLACGVWNVRRSSPETTNAP